MNKMRSLAMVQFSIAFLIVAALVLENKYLWFAVDIIVIFACVACGALLLKGSRKAGA